MLVWQHVSEAGNTTWYGRACADITIREATEDHHGEKGEDHQEDYSQEEIFTEYEHEQDTLEDTNKTMFDNNKKLVMSNDTESEIYDEEILPMTPLDHHNEDYQGDEPRAGYRQMDIQLDENVLLENPEVEIFPLKRTMIPSQSTTKQITKTTRSTTITTKKPKKDKIVQKVKNGCLCLKFSFLSLFVFLVIVKSI